MVFNLKKIIEYGIYLLAFLLSWQTRLILKPGSLNGGYFEYGSVGLYGTDILLIILLVVFLFFLVKNKKYSIFNAQYSIYLFFIGGLELLVFVSIFFAEDKLLAAYKYLWLLIGIGLLFLLNKAEYKRIYLFYSFIVGVLFQSLLGVWQFLNQFAFGSKWLGIAEHDPASLGVSVIEAVGADGIGERWLRAYGGLDHPNIFGGLLAIGILVMIWLLIENKKNVQYSIFNNHLISKYLILTSHFSLLTSCVALFFTFSRSAWLACLSGVAVLLFGGVIKKDWFFQRELLKIVLFSGVLIFVLFFSFGDLATTRIKAQSRLEKKSSVERIESYKEGISIIKENFFFGTGIGNYTLALAKKYPDKPAYNYQPVHNAYLLVFAEIGVLGFAFFCGLLLYIFYNIFKKKDYFGASLFFTLIFLMMFDHYFWSLHFGVLFLFFLLFVIESPHPSPPPCCARERVTK